MKGPSKEWRDLLGSIPGYDPFALAGDSRFVPAAAERALEFFPRFLHHVEGSVAGKPFNLERWQRAIIANLFGWQRKDEQGRVVRRFREALIYIPRKQGKAMALDTPIPTPRGWTTMGQIVEGDELFDDAGNICRVLYATDVMRGHECFDVEFSDGDKVTVDGDHLWTVRDRMRERTITLTTTEMAGSVSCGNRPSHRERRYSVAVPGALQCHARDLPIAPYTLGVWLGDGDSDCARFTVGEQDEAEMVGALAADGTATVRNASGDRAARYRFGNGDRSQAARERSPQAAFRAAGLLGFKHIPTEYLRASPEQRLALLQGLMDTDGCVDAKGACEFTTVLPRLRDDFVELARSLGIKTRAHEHRATINGRDCGPKWRIQFVPPNGMIPFRLKRKVARIRWHDAISPRSRSKQIIAITPVKSVPVRCIRVSSESSLFLAGRGFTPTHNTPLAAGICLYMLFCDNEPGAEVWGAAASGDQAAMLYKHASGMVRQSPQLSARSNVYAGANMRSIQLKSDPASTYKVISADGHTKHGGNPHLILIDELHAQPNRELYDVLSTSMASANRAQSLLLNITTADFARESICNEVYRRACSVRDNPGDPSRPGFDPSFLPVIYEVLPNEDWTLEETWRKANPNIGISVSLEYLRKECKKAQEIPAYQSTFRRLHLNTITESDVAWLDLQTWDRGAEPFPEEMLEGRQCWGGLDLSTKIDLSAFVLCFPPIDGDEFWRFLWRLWIPEDNIRRRVERDRVPYDVWAREGHIQTTPGNVIDYDYIRTQILSDCQRFQVQDIGYDPWNATQLATQLAGEGVAMVEFRQGFASLSEPTKQIEALTLSGSIRHGGNPCVRWMIGNAMVQSDAAGNVKLSKDKSTDRIDGAAAAVVAIGRALPSIAGVGAPSITSTDPYFDQQSPSIVNLASDEIWSDL